MPTNAHVVAQQMSAQAAALVAAGRDTEARELFAAAASHEEAALLEVPFDKQRTRGILAVSVVALRYKAKQYAVAERWCHRLLGEDSLSEPTRHQLLELLEVTTDEKFLLERHRREYAGDAITISLRGGEIGHGTAPFDVALEFGAATRALMWRAAEFSGQFPFRRRGLPPPDVLAAVQARASQPAYGSYRFTVRLTRPQASLFPPEVVPTINPAAVTDTVFGLIHAVNRGDAAELAELVPDRDHRRGLLKVLRTLIPTGGAVGEVDFLRPAGELVEAATLMPATSSVVRQQLAESAETTERAARRAGQLQGVLRALHLDQNWLLLHLDDGSTMRCGTVEDMLDDVVGPLVNRRVIARGHWRTHRKKRELLVEDLEPAGSPAPLRR